MAKLIKQIHDLIDLATDKGVTDYFSRPQLDNAIDQGQMILYRQLVKDFAKNKRVRNDLLPFEVVASVTITAGIGSLPSDFEDEIEAYYTTGGIDYPVSIKESGFYRKRIRDVVSPPSATDPIATINLNTTKKIEVSPTLTPITLRYWKLPTKPTYATTTVNSQIVYDDTASVDVLWSRALHDIIMENTFKVLGLNLREMAVLQAGLKAFPKEATL